MKYALALGALAAAFASSGCASILESLSPSKKPPTCTDYESPTAFYGTAGEVGRLACYDPAVPGTFERQYAAFDEDGAQPLAAAILVLSCHANDACYEPDERGGPVAGVGYSAALYEVAKGLDVAEVERAVAKVAPSDELAAKFTARFADARRRLIDTVEGLDLPLKRIYVLPVQRARRRWAEERVAVAELVSRADEMLPQVRAAVEAGTVTDDQRLAIEALRASYVEECRRLGTRALVCLGRQVPRDATELLVRIAIAQDEPARQKQALALLTGVPDRSELAYELHAEVAAALVAERARYAEYRDAKGRGASARQLEKRFGTPLPRSTQGLIVDAGIKAPKFRKEFPRRSTGTPSGSDEQTVQRVTRRKGVALIQFESHVSGGERGVGCRDTNRVERVDRDGTVVYRRKCKRWVKSRVVYPQNPVLVPLDEAAGIRPGDRVAYAFLGPAKMYGDKKVIRVGRVLYVWKRDKAGHDRGQLVQLGPFRLE